MFCIPILPIPLTLTTFVVVQIGHFTLCLRRLCGCLQEGSIIYVMCIIIHVVLYTVVLVTNQFLFWNADDNIIQSVNVWEGYIIYYLW